MSKQTFLSATTVSKHHVTHTVLKLRILYKLLPPTSNDKRGTDNMIDASLQSIELKDKN